MSLLTVVLLGLLWTVFVLLSILGGLGFSLPLYWWMNTHCSRSGAVAGNGSA